MLEATLNRLSDFDYALPKAQIAQFGLPRRRDARLMVVHRERETFEHRTFQDLVDYFERGDVLVLNDTFVLPARLFARKKTGARVEILVLTPSGVIARKQSKAQTKQSNRFEIASALPGMQPRNDGLVGISCQVLIKPSGRVRQAEELILNGEPPIVARVLDEPDRKTGIRHVEFETDEDLEPLLDRIGRIPLPPYIDREDTPVDRALYQTVFAKRPGAVASPTAGLHFDEELLRQLEVKGVEVLYVTLHVSYGTFQPVQAEDLMQHHMYVEYFDVSDEAAEQINLAKMDGRPIVCCGTTVVRALESAAIDSVPPEVEGKQDKTDLFIYPPYQFRIPVRLITNFHLPKSTVLMLTGAFTGHDLLIRAYREAIEEKYRFYSYGDAMLIL